ncbi:hypothetical protein BpHYR1_031443 [Brachionus plicatilis]|uniref:Uncharacterized protein n=1 Tax=Brachionus plicatilis TaxID=10195 RepID=A0A3M7QN04_BRAPC|nr:hypothetical protein BpHYR1_031443 [Brachionus plicatilis]
MKPNIINKNFFQHRCQVLGVPQEGPVNIFQKAKQPNYKDLEIKTPNNYMRQIIHVSASITTWKDNLNIFFVESFEIDTLNVSSDTIYSINFEVLEILIKALKIYDYYAVEMNFVPPRLAQNLFKQRFKCEAKNEKKMLYNLNKFNKALTNVLSMSVLLKSKLMDLKAKNKRSEKLLTKV